MRYLSRLEESEPRVRTRRTKTEAGKTDRCQRSGRHALPRFVGAMFLALTLLFMPLAMSSGLAMTHTATVGMPDMGHCAGEHERSPDKQPGGMIDCAIACAAVRPTAPQMTAGAGHVRQILEPQPVPLLKGIRPDVIGRPPRLFPEA